MRLLDHSVARFREHGITVFIFKNSDIVFTLWLTAFFNLTLPHTNLLSSHSDRVPMSGHASDACAGQHEWPSH